MTEENKCSECGGRTIEFKGSGKDAQYKICSRYQEVGHLTEEEIKVKLSATMRALRPSGRFD